MSSVKILLIDDDGSLASMLSEYLSAHGLKVEWAPDAGAGLERLGQGGFDVVVLDVMLPGLDGFGALSRLRRGSDVPVLMLTARGEDTETAGVPGGDRGGARAAQGGVRSQPRSFGP